MIPVDKNLHAVSPLGRRIGGACRPWAAGLVLHPLRAAARRALGAFARETRAAAGLELALGCALVLLPVSYACLDLYSRVDADTAAARVAATMADYVSRGPETAGQPLDGNALKKLGEFLWKQELGAPAALVYVVTALRQPAGTPAPAVKVLWSDATNLRFGDATAAAELADDCFRFVEESGGQKSVDLPDGFTMAAGEVTIVVEVCARLTGFGALANLAIGDVYRLHVLPARTPGQGWAPNEGPNYAALGEGGSRGPFGTASTLAAAAVLPVREAREDGPPAAPARFRSPDVAGPLPSPHGARASGSGARQELLADQLLPSPPGRGAGGKGRSLALAGKAAAFSSHPRSPVRPSGRRAGEDGGMTAMRTPGPAAAATPRPRLRPRAAAGAGRALGAALRRFARDTRAAAGIATAMLTIGVLGGAALIVDHVWLYDQRDVLKTAAEAASTAATLELGKNSTATEADLRPVAERYIVVNLAHLPSERLTKAKETLVISFEGSDLAQGTVKVTATADLGGTLFSRHLPLLGNYEGPEDGIKVEAGVDSDSKPAEVVLAIDISTSMEWNLAQDDVPPAGSPDSRIEIVKRAASDLVDILKPDADNRVAVGVVPWHIQVRLESDTADYWVRGGRGWAVYPTQRFYEVPYVNCDRRNANACTNPPLPDGELQPLPDRATIYEGWKGCLTEARTGSGTAAELPKTAADRFAPPSQNPFAQGYFSSGFGNAYKCLDPRSADFSTRGLQYQACYQIPSGMDAAELRLSKIYPAVHPDNSPQRDCAYDTATILPLSTNPDEIKERIEKLSPVGSLTYSALGLLWGQRLLMPSWKSAWGGSGAHPLDPSAGEDEVRKAIVLLTDGEDTYCGRGKHDCKDSPVGIWRAEACDEAKSRGTEIFVVAAMNPANISTQFGKALEQCSSQKDAEYPTGTHRPGGNYVFLNNGTPEALKAAFADIASQLRTLRRIL